MSIIGRLRQITPAQVGQFRAHPEAAYKLILGPSKDAVAHTSRQMEARKRRNAAVLLQSIAAGGKTENLDPTAKAAFDKAHHEFTQIARDAVLHGYAAFLAGNEYEEHARKRNSGISLEKAWHGIHFLLTGQADGGAPPLSWTVLGHEEIADTEKLMGYGPAHLLTPAEVHDVAVALSKLEKKALFDRFDPQAMQNANVYAFGGGFDYFWAYLIVLKAYYAQAARLRKGMLSYFQ